MNWDISTKEGLNNSIAWFEDFVTCLRPGGTWIVPRSASGYRIDHENKTIDLTFGPGDPSTEKVAVAAGWAVTRP